MTAYDNMVQHDPNSRVAAQARPPLCPQCGSHRTEIVGVSKDTERLVVRCTSCGVRSNVASEAPVDGRPESSPSEELNAELAAIQAVGLILAELRDQESRKRVLRWAFDHFQMEAFSDPRGAGSAVAAPEEHRVRKDNDTLSLDGLILFADRDEPDEIAEFPVRERPSVAADQSLESLVQGFVANFQRVALQCQVVPSS